MKALRHALVDISYGYNRDGSRLWREDAVAADLSKHFDERYVYDAAQRLVEMARGNLNDTHATITAKTLSQDWTLDATGNWRRFLQDVSSVSSLDLVQHRAHSRANEITDVTETVGESWATPVYDRAGNMKSMPRPRDPAEDYTAKYDAWNRLVELREGEGRLARYFYDGANRRIIHEGEEGSSPWKYEP